MADNSFGIKELNLVGSGTPKIQSPNNINLEAVTVAISTNATVGGNLSVSGTLTGDGSGLTGVVGSGSGIAIKHDGAIVGTAGTIDFSTNLDVSAISGAAVTITASGGGAAGIDTTGTSFFNQLIVTGISTFGNSVSIGHSGSNNNTINFTTNDSNYGGSLQFDTTTAKYYLYSTYQGTTYTPLEIGSGINNYIKVSGGLFYPASNNGTDLGSNSTRFKTVRVTDVDAVGVATVANKINVGTGATIEANGQASFAGNVISDATVSAASKVTVGSGATIEANGQASFTGIITSKSSILVEGGSTIVDIGSGNQGFYLYNGASTHLAISWSSSASRNQFRGDAGGSHPLWFEDFSYVYVDAPLSVSSNNDFKVGSGVTIQSSGGANFVGVITAGSVQTTSSITSGSDLDIINGTIRRDAKLWLMANSGNPLYYAGTPSGSAGDHIFSTFLGGFSYEKFRIGADGDIGLIGENYGTSGQVLTSGGAGSPVSWTTVSGGIGTNGSVNTTGIITAAQFSGVGNDIVTARWTLGANGTSDFTFTGPGFPTTQNDPVIYLARGQTYEFENNSGGSHPFQIQDSEDNPYTTGVTYPNGGASATSGITTFAVPFTASNSLQYKCTSHSSMGNTIVIYPNLNV